MATASNVTHFDPAMDKPRALVLLQKARKMIEEDGQSLICFAIDAAENQTTGNGQSYYLKEWVRSMLGPCNTYLVWVKVHHPDLLYAVPFDERFKKAKEGRLAWLDWMIGELQ